MVGAGVGGVAAEPGGDAEFEAVPTGAASETRATGTAGEVEARLGAFEDGADVAGGPATVGAWSDLP